MARLHLRMAVRAEEDALLSLFARLFETPCDPLVREREALPEGIEMMKLEGGDTAVVAAHPTSAAGLGDEDPFDLPAPLRHALLGTTLTTVGAPRVEPEAGRAVARAGPFDLPGCVRRQRQLEPGVTPLDLPAAKPVPNRGDRPIKCLGHLSEAGALSDEPLETFPIRSPARCEPLRAWWSKAV